MLPARLLHKAAVLLVLLMIHSPLLGAANGMAEFRSQFQAGRCNLLEQPLRSYRSALLERGRINLQVDYMLAVCRCRIPGLTALRQLPSVYRHLTPADRRQIEDAEAKCDSGIPIATLIPPGRARVEGKGGSRIVAERSQMSDEVADRYERRIFDKGSKEAALASLQSRGFAPAIATGNFVLTGDVDRAALRSTGRLMDDAVDRFASQFRLQAPRTLITVYLFKHKADMRAHARTEHGIQIPAELWAYTFPLDASITVWVSGGLGTVGHEVMHALLDQNAPYAPPWLNEGTAALFEEFRHTRNGGIEGTFRDNHWRVPHLRSTGPTPLRELLYMDWAQFDDAQSLQRNHATAKFFAMYLQERNKLRDVLAEFSEHDLFESAEVERALTKRLGSNLNDTARDFNRWLSEKIGTPGAVGSILDEIRLNNSARYIGNNTYEWTAFIEGASHHLAQIEQVVYYLHPSFPRTVYEGDASQANHPITATGWGEFELKARVVLKNGQRREYRHWLQFR